MSPFGLVPLDELGQLQDSLHDTALDEAASRRPSAGTQPIRAFVGNAVPRMRYRHGGMIVLGILAIFFVRAGLLQVVHGASYRALAEANRVRIHILPAERGVITDRFGTVLANNTPSFTLVGRPTELPQEQPEREQVLQQVATLVDGDVNQFIASYEAAVDSTEFALMQNVPYEQAMTFAVHDTDIHGVDLVLGEQRSYITTTIPSLSHVLGYTGLINTEEYAEVKDSGYVPYDYIGKQGVEASHETTLRGTYGKETIEVNASGKYLRTIGKQDPLNGERLTLTIDSELQAYAEEVLRNRLEGTVSSRASLVAMDPTNGEVLALVSWPAYDANVFSGGINQTDYSALLNDPDHPLFPRATAGEYPAGSTIKPVYAAAALSEGIITPTTTFLSSGGLQTGDHFFPDWRAGGHGVTNVYHAIADSVNTFFYIIGGGYEVTPGLGINRLMTWAATFGFGSPSGLDIPGEADGFLPSPEWKQEETGESWYIGNTYNVSIGQGDFLVTPLQIARATSVFANDGDMVTPHLDMKQSPITVPVVSSEIADVIRDAMRETVTKGSASSLQSVPVPVAGKTGTAQWSSKEPPHSWFTGFAPYDNPSITITIVVENGGDTALAIPVAREILEWYFRAERQDAPPES